MYLTGHQYIIIDHLFYKAFIKIYHFIISEQCNFKNKTAIFRCHKAAITVKSLAKNPA